MTISRNWIRLCVLLGSTALMTAAERSKAGHAGSAPDATKAGEHWEIAGDLTEACTCAVPCTCNFGEGPSRHHYCYALFSLDIHHGHYGNLNLDGLRLAGAHG